MNFVDLIIGQAIVLHKLNKVEVFLPELPRLDISRAITLFVLLAHANFLRLGLPIQEVAPEWDAWQPHECYACLGVSNIAPVFPLTHFVEVNSNPALIVICDGTHQYWLALHFITAIHRVFFFSVAFDEVECRLYIKVLYRLHVRVHLVWADFLIF